MDQNRLKGYGLTYLGWIIATVAAGVLSYILTYTFFKDAFPSWADFGRYQEGAAGAAVVAGVGAIAVFIIAFGLIGIAGSILALQVTLKKYPAHRTATTVWLCALSLLAPAIFAVDVTLGLHYWLIAGWLILTPLFGRLIATKRQ